MAFIPALVVIIAFIGGAGSLGWNHFSKKAIAANHGVWIARYWEEGKGLEEIVGAIYLDRGIVITLESWSEGSEDVIAVGPEIGRERLVIYTNRRIEWERSH
jgi:hypothetical protein